ncbi:MAG: SRPBCC family protein [Candidatus Dormibacteraeota bacterium]|nr:SRPBCC family protein [Candidatus Dormibacteraeota bacterium]MBV9525080.1 SRPBCC family protein [Candidatus Dormibacteraeota bacterium]
MIEIEQRIVVPRPVHDVYDFVITRHAENHPRWDPDVVRVEQLDPGDVRVGTRFAMGRKMMGRVQDSTLEVTECEPDRRVVMRSESRAMDITFVNAFEEEGSATRLTFRAEAEPHGPLRVMSPFIKEQFGNGLRRSLENIRSLLEGAPIQAQEL